MTITEMLVQSGILALLGIGIVFSFLVILVIAISLVGKIINSGNAGKNDAVENQSAEQNNEQITAAISAAVTEYKKSH